MDLNSKALVVARIEAVILCHRYSTVFGHASTLRTSQARGDFNLQASSSLLTTPMLPSTSQHPRPEADIYLQPEYEKMGAHSTLPIQFHLCPA